MNEVKDKPFKGKPFKKQPDSGKGIKFSNMKKSKVAKDADANPNKAKPIGENKYLKILGTKATVMHPVTRVAKKVDKKDVRKYVQKGYIHMTTKRNQLRKEDAPTNAVAHGGVDMAPNAGPRVKEIPVTDRRRRKDKEPRLLKRFRKFTEDHD